MIIIRDTREKQPWDFSRFDECEGQITRTVKTGDYQILGKEHRITIDRKKSPSELSMNLGRKYKTFKKELIRMADFDEAYILLEFSLNDLLMFPENESAKFATMIQMNGASMIKQINTIEKKYNVRFIFCNNREEAQDKAIELFKRIENETE